MALWHGREGKKGGNLKQGNGQLVSSVDESLKKEGILKTQNPKSEIESPELQPPASDLSQIKEEPIQPLANPAEVLGDIDKRLEKGGKELGELPPPPQVSSKLFATRPSKTKKKRSTVPPSSTRGLLDSIDKGLGRKGIETPQIGPIPTGQPKGNREGVQTATRQEKQEKIELTPRLSVEKNPLLDAGDYQLKEKPGEAGKPGKREGSDASKQAGVQASEPLKELPKGVVKGPPTHLPKERPAEITSADKMLEEEEKGAFDQISEDLKSLGSLLNPFSW